MIIEAIRDTTLAIKGRTEMTQDRCELIDFTGSNP
jgi:hypothetical protein